MKKAVFFVILTTFSATSFALRQPDGMKTAIAFTTLRTVKCDRLNIDAIASAKRQLGNECNYLAEEFHLPREQSACENELQLINGLVKACDAQKFRDVADRVSEIIKRAMHHKK